MDWETIYANYKKNNLSEVDNLRAIEDFIQSM